LSGRVVSSLQRPLPDNTQHSQQTDIYAPAGFEPTISAGERPQNYALGCVATGTSKMNTLECHNDKTVTIIMCPMIIQPHQNDFT